MRAVPVIDLFAGPGGLGEGFSRERSVNFRIAVSIEKDPMAFETLRLRAAYRELSRKTSADEVWSTWDSIIAETPWSSTFDTLRSCGDRDIESACAIAATEALNLELGPRNRAAASSEIRKRLLPFTRSEVLPRNAVLIGGPPCQAYSIVGRSRNKGNLGYKAEADHRHFLYLEYLHVIGEFEPAVFVMENVKGILTSRVHESQIFETIMKDLKRPGVASKSSSQAEYVLCTLSDRSSLLEEPTAEDFIIRAEEHGVPQARHRVIILGIREDVFRAAQRVGTLERSDPPTVGQVISGLPSLRPRLSHRGQGLSWIHALRGHLFDAAIRELRRDRTGIGPAVAEHMLDTRRMLDQRQSDPGYGADRIMLTSSARQRHPRKLKEWYMERDSAVLANHESRAHMPGDLVRYLFVAAFGKVTNASPRLHDFPKCLLPEHKNVDPENVGDSIFKDRFRVQLAGRHAMTVTSHIAKDGHAFVHPSTRQCRSLTVREAARLQTFPDSYVFLGNRTSQYIQVGNAVPPYLARQIASVVADTMVRAGMAHFGGTAQGDWMARAA